MDVKLRIKFPWWMNSFIFCCKWFGVLMNMTPDQEKIQQTILKHSKSYINTGGKWTLLQKGLN